jgi:hypothetical protein
MFSMASNDANSPGDASPLVVLTYIPPASISTADSRDKRIERVFSIRIRVTNEQQPKEGQQSSNSVSFDVLINL